MSSSFKKLANLMGDLHYNTELKKEVEKFLFNLIGEQKNGDQ